MESKWLYLVLRHREAAKIRRQRNMVQMKNPRKRIKCYRHSQPSRCRVQNTGGQSVKDLTEYSKSIKEEMKALCKGNKEKSTGNQQWKEEAGIQTNDLEHKEEINIQPQQNEETKPQKNEESLKETLAHLQKGQQLNNGATRRRRRARNWKLIWKNNERKLP